METSIIYWVILGIMEKKRKLLFRVSGFGEAAFGCGTLVF